jgi:hypothetical protein
MFRWKLFIPLTIFLTVLALGGNFLTEAKLAGSGVAGIADPSITELRLTRQEMIVVVEPGQLRTALLVLEDGGAQRQLVGRRLSVKAPQGQGAINSELRLEAELLLAQAVATREYWQVGQILKEQAARQGYQANLYVWGSWFIMEIYNSTQAYYGGRELSQ